MKLIGLTGGMGAGKSTAVEFMKEKYGADNVALVKLAQPLYDIQEAIYKIIEPVHKRPSNFVKDRFLLQFLGTDWGRGKISQDIWLDLWRARAHSKMDQGLIVVVDDVRYDNEATMIKDCGGTVLEIISHNALDRISTNTGISGHISENGIDPELVDYAIVNDGTLEQFKKLLNSTFNVALSGK